MEIFKEKVEIPEENRRETTIQLTLINRVAVDEQLKDRLREVEVH